jgi:cytochrome P450
VTTNGKAGKYFDPFDSGGTTDPDELLRASRNGCPVHQVNDTLYAVYTDRDVRQVFDDNTHFSNRGNFRLTPEDIDFPVMPVTNADPPQHTALRARLLKDLSPRRLRSMKPVVEDIVTKSVARLPQSGRVELYNDYIRFIPAAVVYALIGIPEDQWAQVQEWSDAIVAVVPEPVEAMPEFAGLTGLVGELARRRLIDADNRQEDVLDNLCFAEAAEAEMNLTRALITNCVFRLLEQHEQWEAVVADRSLLSNAVEESLRHDSPAQFMVRSVTDGVAVGGCRMEAGKKVYLSIQSANHDEKAWGSDGQKYRADRPDATGHLAFGRGIHACIGAPLARIEAISAISALIDRFPNAVLAPDARWERTPSAVTRRIASLPVLLGGH